MSPPRRGRECPKKIVSRIICTVMVWWSFGCFVVAWGVLGSFKGPHDGYANRSNSQTSLPRPTDFTDSLLRAVGQPTIFGTPLVVRQRIKYSLGRA